MSILNFLLIFSLYIIFVHTGILQDKLLDTKIIKIDKIDGRCSGKPLAAQLLYKGFKSDGNVIFIANNTVLFNEDINDKPKITFTITRCYSKENLDSCEQVNKIANIDFCQSINPDGLFGQNPLAAPYEPKLKCPIKKGSYHAYNFTVNMAPFIVFNLEEWYWKVKIELFSAKKNQRLMAAICIESHAIPKSSTTM